MSYFFDINSEKDNQNLDTLKTLMNLVAENDLGKLKIKEGELEIVIEGKSCTPPPPQIMPHMDMPIVEPMARVPQPQSKCVQSVIADSNVKVETSTMSGNVVKAPIVGTFYSSPSPTTPAYVKVGDTVKKGDIIMIIESMKLMNEVTSEFNGVVKEIMVQDGCPVEYDQPIMIIE